MTERRKAACALAFLCSIAVPAACPPVLAQEQDVTVVLAEDLDILDPCHATRSNIGWVLRQNVAETLTEIDPADGTIEPRLATAWEQVDDDTWRFELRRGVKFHDGESFNAESAAFAINRALDRRLDCEVRTKFFDDLKVATEVVDEDTLEVTTVPPEPILPTRMSAMTIVSPRTVTGELTREPVGTGPYVFASFEAGRQTVLERFDGYWGQKPQIGTATYVWRAESAVRAAMVEAGEADIAPDIAMQDATDPAMDVSYLNSETSNLRITHSIPPLDDIRVRKALNLGIDRAGMRGTIFSPDVVPATQLVVPSTNGYNPALENWAYDPEAAMALVEEARADGVPVDREIVLIARPGFYPSAGEAMEATLAMYQAIGLNVKLQTVEVAQWTDLVTKPYAGDRPPMVIQSQHDNNKGDAVFTVYFKYHSDGAQSDTSNPAVDKLIDAANAATGAERQHLYQELFRSLHEDVVPEVMMYHMVGYARVGPRIAFKPTISTNNELQLQQITFK